MMRTRKGYKVYPLTVAQRFHAERRDADPFREG